MIEAAPPEGQINPSDLWQQYRSEQSPEEHDLLRKELIERFAPIVKAAISRLPVHLPNHIDQDDLVGYGAIGLTEAIDRFDPEQGVKFETFARKRIRGAALDAVRNQSQFSRGANEHIRTISATYTRLEESLGRPAEDEEVAAELGITAKKLDQTAQLAAWEMLSLDQPLRSGNSTGVTLGETIDSGDAGPEDEAIHNFNLENLGHAMDRLPERDKMLIELYYVESLTMQQIAEIFHVTKPRICQIHSRALVRLRGIMEPEEQQESA